MSTSAVSVSCAEIATTERKETNIRPLLWAALAALAILYFGPSFLRLFRPTPDNYADFVQEWLSARNFWAGDPVYMPQRVSMYRRTGQDIPAFDVGLPWNAHPPVTVLLALPFGTIADYRDAHLVWNLCTFPLVALSIWLIFSELRMRWNWNLAVLTGCYLISASPVRLQLFQGQLNSILLLLLVAGWIADRRGHQLGAGVAIGVATALKLYPGLLLIYFAFTGRWRAIAAVILVGLTLNAVALAVFGASAFETYVRQVIPSLEVFRGAWSNYSATGYWTRVGHQFHIPLIGTIAAIASQCLVVAVVALAGWRIRSIRDRDLAYALSVIGMTLASPVAWGHYLVMLVLPMILAWYYLPCGRLRHMLVATLVVLWIREIYFPCAVIGYEQTKALSNTEPVPDNPVLCLVALGAIPYALASLFVLTGWARFTRSQSMGLTDR